MKHIWIVCLVFFVSSASNAQTFTVEMDSTTWFGMSYTTVGKLTNTSADNIMFGLTVIPQTLPNDWGMAICTPNGCLTVLEDTFTIAPSVTVDLWIEFYTNYNNGYGTALVVLVDLADSSTMYLKTLVADITTIGIQNETANAALFYNYPNPFYATTQIKYRLSSGKGTLLITNMLGEPLKKYTLNNHTGLIQLDLSLPPGTYFYSLYQDQKRVAQRKMLLIR